jgi:hypothetical protein
MKITTPGQRGFLAWLNWKLPHVYRAMEKRNPGLFGKIQMSGLGLVAPTEPPTTAPPPSSWMSSISELAKVYLTTSAQKKMWDLQMKQAQAGLPPLDLEQYQPGVSVGVSKGTQNLLMWGALGLGAVYLLPKLLGRR